MTQKIIFFICLCVGFTSCSSTPDISSVVYDMGPSDTNAVQVDLSKALSKGIEIPTKKQTKSGYFTISFQVDGSSSKKYYYKIYYQNESYKFPENRDTTDHYNPLAEENFYGSWEETSIGFKPVPSFDAPIIDSIRIIGNPRNESKYFGPLFETSFWSEADIQDEMKKIKKDTVWYAGIIKKAAEKKISTAEQLRLDAKWMLKNDVASNQVFSKEEINSMKEFIRKDNKWMEGIKEKAITNKVSTEEQLYMDAEWILANDSTRAKQNNRWKRNPRMGKYSMMIVVASEEDLANIPKYIQHINLPSDSGNFINPYYYFNNKKIREQLPSTAVFMDSSFITVSASLDLSAGIYADGLEYPGSANMSDSGLCGWNKDLYMKAHFSQFFSTLQKDFYLNTIPVIQDVNDSSYSLEDYHQAENKFPEKALKKDYIRNTESPCGHVQYNTAKKGIEIINPGNKNLETAHKSNMGIKTRVGFTYGKITAKIKFPELINKDNVWNGLTNAFWLLFQDEQSWNYRRACKTGYTAKGDGRNEAPRYPQTHYSEIDFELVKTSRYWPNDYYRTNKNVHTEDAQKTDDIVVGCTNWDLTCKDCRWYIVGLDTIRYEKNAFEMLRWDNVYQALTTRTPAKDDELFKGPYYYYQFEWTPDHIIWRIGPEKDKLRMVGYMTKEITSIPNNQMIAVITQEYHLSEWWPPIPFKQEYIPFPKNDIKGTLYELTIE